MLVSLVISPSTSRSSPAELCHHGVLFGGGATAVESRVKVLPITPFSVGFSVQHHQLHGSYTKWRGSWHSKRQGDLPGGPVVKNQPANEGDKGLILGQHDTEQLKPLRQNYTEPSLECLSCRY